MSDEQTRTSRTENSITKVPVNPDYLAKYVEQDTSLDSLKEYREVPKFKIVQATTDAERIKTFGIGTVIVCPGGAMICKYEEEPDTFQFVPLFFFVEWAKWRDQRGNGPHILNRSYDPSSEIAAYSKSAEQRKELYIGQEEVPDIDKMYYQYVEHLRFVGVIYGSHPLAGTPVTLSFERGEWGQGKNFIAAVSLRRQVVNSESIVVPLWAQVWELGVVHHAPDATRKWFGFKFIAAEPSIILPEEADVFKALHNEFKELHDKQRLIVQDDEDKSPDEAAVKANENF